MCRCHVDVGVRRTVVLKITFRVIICVGVVLVSDLLSCQMLGHTFSEENDIQCSYMCWCHVDVGVRRAVVLKITFRVIICVGVVLVSDMLSCQIPGHTFSEECPCFIDD